MKFFLFLTIFSFLPFFSQGQDNTQKEDKNGYLSPGPFSFLTNFPGDVYEYSKRAFHRNNYGYMAGMTVGTLALIVMDQQILDGSKIIGAKLNIDPNSSQKKILGKDIQILSNRTYIGFEGPHDLSSAMYFIGDGWVHMSIASGFLAQGYIAKDNKSKQVANALFESMVTSGIVVQFFKHITGRESPFVSTAPGGVWRFFPDQNAYHASVPKYDAYPSGHVAATMATITVLSEYYPDKAIYIKPIGYSLLGVLMFAMLNNGVHWASDYPLGIATGYSFAKIAVKRNRQVSAKKIKELQ